jgi:hypothetical protein
MDEVLIERCSLGVEFVSLWALAAVFFKYTLFILRAFKQGL